MSWRSQGTISGPAVRPITSGESPRKLFQEDYFITKKIVKEVLTKKLYRYSLPGCCWFCNLVNFGYQESWKFAIIHNLKYKLLSFLRGGKFPSRTGVQRLLMRRFLRPSSVGLSNTLQFFVQESTRGAVNMLSNVLLHIHQNIFSPLDEVFILSFS